MAKKIVVECKPDEKLARMLGFPVNQIAHQPSKGEVCNYLRKETTALAIIDEDPGSSQPNYLKEFAVKEEKHGIKKLVGNTKQTNNKVILVLRPRLEEWIIQRCSESKIDLEEFGLPSHNRRLKDEINYRLPQFERLLKALSDKNDNGMIFLRENSH